MARKAGSFGFWDFLSGRAAAETEPLPLPKIKLDLPGRFGAAINPIRTDELLLFGAGLAVGYLVCKITGAR